MRLLLSAALFVISTLGSPSPQLPPHLFDLLIAQKLLATANLTSGIPTSYPQYTTRDTGSWLLLPANTWTSGFLPATFYALAERTKLCPRSMNGTTRDQWLEIARTSATGEIPLETHTGVGHDVGFLSLPFVDELELYVTPTLYPNIVSPFPPLNSISFSHTFRSPSDPLNITARDAVEKFATALAARFSPVVGCTRSWDNGGGPDALNGGPDAFQVIIDNIMTIDVLFVAADLTGNDTLRQIAISHADKTTMNHVRTDGAPPS